MIVLVDKVGKFAVIYISVGPRGTKAHWVIPLHFFCGRLTSLIWIQVHIPKLLKLIVSFITSIEKFYSSWLLIVL